MSKRKILLVDDECAFTRMMKLVLEQTGLYEVFCENNARQAVATARACQPDLILLDVVMPDMDGGDVAALLQEDPLLKDVPIVFLTALVGSHEASKGPLKQAGFRFLGKLASDADLLQCIQDNLQA
jgi:CheY-like chemotaxis protein